MKDRKLNNPTQNPRLKQACALSIMLLLVLFSEVRSSAQQLAAHASIAPLSYTDFILPKPIYLLDFPKDTTAKDTSGFDSFNQKMEKLFKIQDYYILKMIMMLVNHIMSFMNVLLLCLNQLYMIFLCFAYQSRLMLKRN